MVANTKKYWIQMIKQNQKLLLNILNRKLRNLNKIVEVAKITY